MPAGDDGSSSADNIFFSGGELIDIGSDHWRRVPTDALRALLVRRAEDGERPACGSGVTNLNYNTPIHVFALFLILFLSTLSCAFPIIVRRFPQLRVPTRVLFLSRHFGTGVLIATAFVHLLPTAFISLTDECLPPFFNERYQALPGAIAMISVLLVVGVEMFFASRGAAHVHGVDFDGLYDPESSTRLMSVAGRPSMSRPQSLKRLQRTSFDRLPDMNVPQDYDTDETARLVDNAAATPSTAGLSPTPPTTHTPRPDGEADNDAMVDDDDDNLSLELNELDPMPAESTFHSRQSSYQPLTRNKNRSQQPNGNASSSSSSSHHHHHHHHHGRNLSGASATPQSTQKQLLQVLLLEAGILFHSIFIGMALSVSTGAPFVVFLLAISFHQTFEGLALGARIAAISFPARSPKPWLMALAFGTTTPIGQAIGLGVRHLYDPQGQAGLIVVGSTNAVSSGLLLYAGLVALLAEDFLSDESYVVLRGRRRAEACIAVVLGAFGMALVGAWA